MTHANNRPEVRTGPTKCRLWRQERTRARSGFYRKGLQQMRLRGVYINSEGPNDRAGLRIVVADFGLAAGHRLSQSDGWKISGPLVCL